MTGTMIALMAALASGPGTAEHDPCTSGHVVLRYEDWRHEENTKQPHTDFALTPVWRKSAQAQATERTPGLKVVTISADKARRYCLRKGDVILKIDGVSTTAGGGFEEVSARLDDGKAVEFEILRKDRIVKQTYVRSVAKKP